MALEAVVFPQDPFTYACKEFFYPIGGSAAWANDFCFQEEEHKALLAILDNNVNGDIEHGNTHHLHANNWDSSSTSVMQPHDNHQWDPYSSPETCTVDQSLPAGAGFPAAMEAPPPAAAATTTTTTNNRRKRRRTRSSKNKEELENQRMTHITVERNRRKQMNEYLAVLRSLMPPSYVQRFSTPASQCNNNSHSPSPPPMAAEPMAAAESMADIEVTMVETHANLKILSKKQPRQLLKLVANLQSLRLTILHLNVTTTADDMALYSISVKVEEGCHLNTVDEIAAAVNQMLRRIQEEAAFSREM
ncbi:hypothetical protein COLO4_11989 [Corchorus olitorius]|uniref:BHLH domain-containing protein n=1 Tax=Corchorus olitorius TaxID=93759 RepID=A0A1R3K2H2_9ROSI|nr:hypothetical protein COLO4_11989 [Corchorus olitorius]